VTLPTAIAHQIDASGDCWEWQGPMHTRGYGRVWWDGKRRLAHRVVYALLVDVPRIKLLPLHHLCENKVCVNPDHLEPLSQGEHLSRHPNHNSLKTHCPQGHPYGNGNLIITRRNKTNGVNRFCRACRQAKWREWYRRQPTPYTGRKHQGHP
jgi:hypothetical protein